MEIYQVGSGASINQTARFANVTLAESDGPSPTYLIFFGAGSRLPVATLKTTRLDLEVRRPQASAASVLSVRYRMLVSGATG